VSTGTARVKGGHGGGEGEKKGGGAGRRGKESDRGENLLIHAPGRGGTEGQ